MLSTKEYNLYLESLQDKKAINLCVRGRSMYPVIKDYDSLIIEPIADKDIRLGDILLIDSVSAKDCTLLIHRLVRIDKQNEKSMYYTKGDNAISCIEGPFAIGQIKGRVASVRRNNISINLNKCSPLLAFFSLRLPHILKAFNVIADLLLERSLVFGKLIKRLKARDPLYFNAQELCLLLLRGQSSEEIKIKAIGLIQEGIRWNYFCDIAITSGRVGFGLSSLKAIAGIVGIPDFAFKRLESYYFKTIAETEKCNVQLKQLVEYFSQSFINVIVLKGTYLSQRLYGDITCRGPSADIDLLIKESDRFKACELMGKMGYQKVTAKEVKAWQWHEDFSKPGSYPVDLHWDVTMMNRNVARIEGFWQDSKSAGNKENFYEMKDEAVLLYLCMNLIDSKGYKGLKNFFDINDLIEKTQNLDWDYAVNKAKEYNINNSVFASLSEVKSLFGSRIPGAILNRLKPGWLKRLLIRIFINRSVIFSHNLRRKILDGFLSYILFELLEVSSSRDLLKIAKRVFLPPPESLDSDSNQPRHTDWQYMLCIIKRFCRASYKAVKIFLG